MADSVVLREWGGGGRNATTQHALDETVDLQFVYVNIYTLI